MDWKVVAAGGASIAVVFWGLSELVPALVLSGHLVFASTAEAAKLGVAVSPFFVAVTDVGIGALGLSAVTVVVVRAVKEARKDPYAWVLPALAAAGTLLVDISLEGTVLDGLSRILYLVAMALCLFAGGLAMEKKRFWSMTAGIVLCGIPPLTVISLQLAGLGAHGIADAIAKVSLLSWLWFAVLSAVSVITIKLAR